MEHHIKHPFTKKCARPWVILMSLLLTSLVAHGQLPWLHVENNQIKDSNGNPVTLRGFSLLPNESNDECTTCNTKPVSELVEWQADESRGWYSRVVRIGVHQSYTDPASAFANHIDPFVQQAIAQGQYVIVDLHLVANYDYNGSGGIPQANVLNFWNYVAPRYANNPEVIFEVFNEPINPDNWTSWKNYIQPVVDAIRSVAPDNLILMGGPQWSTRVNQAAADPFSDSNMAYVYHIYPNQGAASTTNLDAKFGNAANTIPVVITEFGWNQDPNYSDGITFGTTGGWGQQFRSYLDNHPQVGWVNYIFDNYWKPQIFDWNWNLMGGENQGRYIRDWLFETQNHNQAGGFNPGPQSAYATHNLPGRIQAEDFDNGGQDAAWHETTYDNQGGSSYRSTPVDIGTTADGGGGHIIGYINNGEWLEYTIASISSGTYSINLRTASADAGTGKSITVKLDGVTLGTVTPTNTGGWETYETLTLSNVGIASGSNKVLRVEFAGSAYNFNWIEFAGTGGNNPPSVSITSPTNGATFTAPASITIEATASDSDGSVTSVAFYNGSAHLGTDSSSPYSYSWTNVPAGNYTLTAVATDNASATTTSSAVGITVNSGSSGGNILEAENTSRWSSGASNSAISDASAGNGQWVRLNADGTGDFVEYSINHTGGQTTYDVYLRYKAGPDRGTCQMYENNNAQGGVFDQYSSTEGYTEILVASDVTLWNGQRKFRFQVAGKNANSSGYLLSQDYIKLVAPGSGTNTHPSASFTYTATNLNVSFDASTSSDPDGSITSYQWDFGDGATGSGATASHTYAAGGDYAVTLTVADNGGATDTDQQLVSVSQPAGTIYESESTSRWSSGASNSAISDAAASNGQWVKLNANSAGDFVEYSIFHSGGQTTYDVYLRYKAGPDRGTCQMYESNSARGPAFDQYSATEGYTEILVASNVTLWDGQRTFRFQVAGKHASSSGYILSQDYLKLIDVSGAGSRTMTTEAEAETPATVARYSHHLLVYPNPVTTGGINIRYSGETGEKTYLRILNLSGQQVYGTAVLGSETTVDRSDLPSGVYLVQIESAKEKITQRLIIE